MPPAVEQQDLQAASSIITLHGKLTLGHGAAELANVVPQVLKSGRKNLVFNLSGVTHIDSTGIGRFIDAYIRLGQIGGEMRICGAAGSVRDSFRVTRLDTVFRFFPTLEAACEGLH
jgi:anti-sigma B factor antagonist